MRECYDLVDKIFQWASCFIYAFHKWRKIVVLSTPARMYAVWRIFQSKKHRPYAYPIFIINDAPPHFQ